MAPTRGKPGTRPFLRLLATALGLLGAPAACLAGQKIPVPNITIYPGDVIRDTMLSDKELPDNFAGSASAVQDRTALIGKTARRTLLPGLPISTNTIGEPKIVTVGAMVRVIFAEGGLTISTYASALQSGAVGDIIPVRKSESGLVISGTIERDGSIRVGNG